MKEDRRWETATGDRRRETGDRRLETEMVGRRPELGDVRQKTCDRRQKM